ncbi:MAG: hypothetical protein RI922_366 [Bacteroidota bacterium]|jgi:uncharacterized protein (DUF1684 family)
MKHLTILLSLFYINSFNAQTDEDSLIELRIVRMGEMIDSSSHILNAEEQKSFEGLQFFKVDSSFRVTAKFTKEVGKKFEMPTSTERKPIYRQFGFIEFSLEGKASKLYVYQNMALRHKKEYKDYLFIPFRDATNGNETYGGGRYLDFKKTTNTEVVVDFNTVYNPYCVYSHRYSCPIPPAENTLTVPIHAGEKVPVGYSQDH